MANTSGGLLSTVNKSNENKDVQKKERCFNYERNA